MAADGMEHRVVSLLPSATEIVVQVGGAPLLKGRSHECDYPPEITNLPMLTSANNGHFTNSRDVHDSTTAAMVTGRGLYAIDADELLRLKPTVVVTQSLCSVCSIDLVTVERILSKAKIDPAPKIVSLNPFSIEDVLQDMLVVGSALGLEAQSHAAVEKLQQRVQMATNMAAQLAPAKYSKCAFLEWIDPLFAGGHWTPQLIAMAGSSHPLNPPSCPGQAAQPSGVVSPEAVTALDPDIIIISPCGLDVATAEEESLAALTDQAWWRDLRAVREGNVVLVDGNAHFNRPGPRLVDALEFLVGLFNDRPDLIPVDFPWKRLQMPELNLLEIARPGKPDVESSGTAVGGPVNSSINTRSPGSTTGANKDRANSATAPAQHGSTTRMPASCAPNLLPDVEEAHAAACAAGSRHYIDPVSGYQVFTEEALRTRGYCCGRRCRHCPYGHLRIKPTSRMPRINRITRPTLLPWCDHPAPLSAHATDVVVLVVLGGQSIHSLAARVEKLRAGGKQGAGAKQASESGCSNCIGLPGTRHVVAVVAVDPGSRSCWRASPATIAGQPATGASGASTGTGAAEAGSLDSVMDGCALLGLPIVAVPVYREPRQQLQNGVCTGNCGGSTTASALSTCQLVVQQAAAVLVRMQQQHLQQHLQLMAELGRCSAGGTTNGSDQQARSSGRDEAAAGCDALKGVVSGMAWVNEEEGEAALPEMPWLRDGLSDENGVHPCRGCWADVVAHLQLPCL